MNIVFLFYDGMTALDVIGPHEILGRLPDAKVFRVAKKRGHIYSESSGLVLLAEHDLSEIITADILLIPGAGSATSMSHDPEVLAWIRKIHVTSTWTTSVCTGSLILGAAGLLKNINATSHWAVLDRLAGWGATPVNSRVVEDGKIMTAAGVSAGIDMALVLADRVAGRKIAQTLQLGIEYDPMPPFEAGSPEKVSPEIRESLKTRLLMSFEK